MRSLATVAVLFALVLGGSSAVGGCGAAGQDEKLEELSRKVATLEKRLKTLEGGKKGAKGKSAKGKSKSGKGKAKAPAGPKAKVEVAGDAVKVLLTNGKRKFTLPGEVPVGEYTVLASFEETAEPAQAGAATVTEGKTTTLTCTTADKACTAAAQ